MNEQEMQMKLASQQEKVEALRQEVAEINKEREYWQNYRIQTAIAAMQSYISDGERMALVSKKFDYDDKIISKFIAEGAVMYADALIAELKKGG
jgi:hypothetical protein